MSADDYTRQVIGVIQEVLANKGFVPPEISELTPFDRAIGLESLDFAEVVIRLEEHFGFDPFSDASVVEIRTVGDLADIYRRTHGSSQPQS